MKRYCKLYNELHTSPSRVQYKQKDFQLVSYNKHFYPAILSARLAQSVEHRTFNLEVECSIPGRRSFFFFFCVSVLTKTRNSACKRAYGTTGKACGLLELALLAVHGLRPRNAILAFPPF